MEKWKSPTFLGKLYVCIHEHQLQVYNCNAIQNCNYFVNKYVVGEKFDFDKSLVLQEAGVTR